MQTALGKRARGVLRVLVAVAMVAVGIAHFLNPEPFVRIVPAALPGPYELVLLSGAVEIAGGVGLLIPRVRKVSGYGLVALYVAVFPANINMAVNHIALDPAHPIPAWIAWARLPFQVLFIALALWVSQQDRATPKGEGA